MIYLILTILSSSSMAIALKIFRTQKGNRYGIILGNYFVCIFLAWLLLPDRSGIFHGSRITVFFGLLAGLFFVLGLVTMQRSIEKNGAMMTTAFAKMGVLFPTLLSMLVFGERPSRWQGIGILLAIAAILCIYSSDGSGKEGESAKKQLQSPVWLLLVMLCNGSSDFLAKLFERIGERAQDKLYFLYLFATAALLTAVLAFYEYRKSGKRLVLREIVAGGAVGIPNYFSSSLLLAALVALPAVVVYPCVSTGTILIVALCSSFFFGERVSRRSKIGLCMILCALVLLNL